MEPVISSSSVQRDCGMTILLTLLVKDSRASMRADVNMRTRRGIRLKRDETRRRTICPIENEMGRKLKIRGIEEGREEEEDK